MKKTLLLLLATTCIVARAQVFPVHVGLQLVPPYSPYLSDYTLPGAQNIIIQIRSNDLSLSDYRCKLRFTIEGAGITIRTREGWVSDPVVLQGGGTPEILYGEDVMGYFDAAALDFYGYTRKQYEKTGRLPEGIYRFTVEVLDFNRGTAVSNKGMTTAWIILNDPPLLNLPGNHAKLDIDGPQNILFSWTPRHTASPNAAFSTAYRFSLVEIWPEDRNPNDAVLTQAPLFETLTNESSLLYSVSEPALLPGRKYAWQVEAHDESGKDLFKNNGRSEVFVFRYGEALAVPANLGLRWAKPTTLALRWDPVATDDPEVKYRLRYRPRRRTDTSHPQWYETWTRFTEKTLYNLDPDTGYEFQVRAEVTAQESEYSAIEVFRTSRPEETAFVCHPAPPPPLPDDSVPVFPLSVNDTIHAGGYDVLVRDVLYADGKYYGSGLAIVPWLNSAKVRVTFRDIRVNEQFWLTRGIIHSLWNATSRTLIESSEPIDPGREPKAGGVDVTIATADSLVTFEGAAIIASITKDAQGNVIVTTTAGQEQVLTPGKQYAIVDDAGNGYIVDAEGNVAKTSAAAAKASVAREQRVYEHKFQFARGNGVLGFDEKQFEALSQYYQQLGDGTFVTWKALSSSRPDVVEGNLLSDDIDPRAVRFRKGDSQVMPASIEGGKITLHLQGKAGGVEEELVAVFQPSDTASERVLGRINLATYNTMRYNLVIVPVNGAQMPGEMGAAEIAGGLNAIYGQAAVEWQATVASSLQVAHSEPFNDGDAGMFTNYSDDMKVVLNAFGGLEANTWYLFLIDEPGDMSLLGYMPRSRKAGFVFIAPHKGDAAEFLKTVAHELGHGTFNLRHTFSEHNLPSGTTDNIMDYSDGTALYKYQWDYIHEPGGMAALFEGEGENALSGMTEEQLAAWWDPLPPYRKAGEILKAHLKGTGVYEQVALQCDDRRCVVTADFTIATDLNYTMEVTLPATMSADRLVMVLISEYHVDLWEAFDVRAEDMWDELYHWWMKQNDDLYLQKGWQVSTLNFLADCITSTTMVPAVEGWITGKHWRDGHELSGWEQGLSALDFLVAEEIAKGCITKLALRIGARTYNLLRLSERSKRFVQECIANGHRVDVRSGDELIILKEGNEIASVFAESRVIKYGKFGGDIVCHPEKTTTVIGKYIDRVSGGGISVIKENKVYKYGENVGGINILDDAQWTLEINRKWLLEALERGDIIRVVSDPTIPSNIWDRGLVGGQRSPFGEEIKLLTELGFRFDKAKFEFVK